MKPFAHQKKSIAFLKKHNEVFDMSDPGTGKTFVQIADISARLKKEKGATLVLASRSLLHSAWGADIKKFAPHLLSSIATAANREAAFATPADIYITNHDAVNWLVKKPKKFFKGFSTLIVDESTAFKHHTSSRSKALLKIASFFKCKRFLSGTPMTNGVTDIWHQMRVLDGGKRLGTSFFGFRSAVCTPKQVGPAQNMVEWVPKPNAEYIVSALIGDLIIRNKFEDCVDIPENTRRTITYTMPKKQQTIYDKFVKEGLLLIESKQVTAINGAVLYGKLLQVASGAVYDDDGTYALIDNERYVMTMDLVEERAHSVVFFYWKHQRDELIKLAKARGVRYAVYDGATSDKARAEITEHFQAGFYQVVFAHPKSAAHGLTWTKARTTIWPSATPNLEWYLQGLKRIHRIGQKDKTETIMVIASNTIEERVAESLAAKDAKQLTLLELLT